MSPDKKKKVISFGVCASLVAVAIAVGTVVSRGGGAFTDIENTKRGVRENHDKIDTLEGKVTKIHTDVTWIRDTMEKEHP